ncbi:hypothetical protein A3F06_04525 [candidate division TM6 bacterium RIFCSPHIGHO2_12_FULL_36_22]|nr:MAG: hypothetical protein A3F06_04525 [candidate division TM6 bacterium RIFCSPHIGHO2_12_FULL_36_22]
MVHLTSRQGFVDQEFCKLLRGERSTERQFLDLLAARKRQTGTSLNVANLVLPDDEISPVRIVCESGKDIIDAPNLEELFAKMFEDYDKDSRIGREMKRYRCNTQFQTLKLRRGERNHFKLCINPRWQFGREGDVIEGPIQMWGNNRFYIQEMKEVPKQDIPPTGILWLVTKLSEGWKELTGS